MSGGEDEEEGGGDSAPPDPFDPFGSAAPGAAPRTIVEPNLFDVGPDPQPTPAPGPTPAPTPAPPPEAPNPFGGVAPGAAPKTIVSTDWAPPPAAAPAPHAQPEPEPQAPPNPAPDDEGWFGGAAPAEAHAEAPADAPLSPQDEAALQRDLARALHEAMQELSEDPSRWEFTAAARLLQAANKHMPRIGASDRISADPVRFGHLPSLSFSNAELRHYRRRDPEDEGPMELMGFQFGLWGPNGALPMYITEELLQRGEDDRRDEATPAFADIFHHRMISLLYAAWERAQIAVGRDRPGADPWEGWLGAAQGTHGPDPRAWRERDSLPPELRRRLTGWFSSGPKSARGAAAVATEAVGAPVEAVEFVGEWLPISPDQRARFAPPHEFGAEGGMRLGQDIVVGDRYYSLQTRIRLRTAPLSLAAYRDLLRSGELFPVLRDAMRAYLGLSLAWELQPVLDVGEAPAPVLDGSVRLGWDCWLSSEPPMRDLDDLVLEGAFGGPGG